MQPGVKSRNTTLHQTSPRSKKDLSKDASDDSEFNPKLNKSEEGEVNPKSINEKLNKLKPIKEATTPLPLQSVKTGQALSRNSARSLRSGFVLSAETSQDDNLDNIEVPTLLKQGTIDSRTDSELRPSTTSLPHSVVHEQTEEGEPSFNISEDKNKLEPPSDKNDNSSSSRYDNEMSSDSSSIQPNPFMTNKS